MGLLHTCLVYTHLTKESEKEKQENKNDDRGVKEGGGEREREREQARIGGEYHRQNDREHTAQRSADSVGGGRWGPDYDVTIRTDRQSITDTVRCLGGRRQFKLTSSVQR